MARNEPSERQLVTRRRTSEHYDGYPFVFDQKAILDEKLHRHVMGRAILDDPRPDRATLDVGCGMCRVALMVREAIGARRPSASTSRYRRCAGPGRSNRTRWWTETTRTFPSGTTARPGDFERRHQGDARREGSFNELARVTKRGGALVVSVYNRHRWYYYVSAYLGAVVMLLHRIIGDGGLKVTVFPFFHLSTIVLMSVVTRGFFRLPLDTSWNLFHDQFTTPHCTFHTAEELKGWARAAGLACEERMKEAANQLITFRLRKPWGPAARIPSHRALATSGPTLPGPSLRSGYTVLPS